MKYFILLFTLLFHTLVYSQLNTSNRTVNQKLYFKAGANFDSLTADRPAYIDSSGDIVSQLLDLTTDVTGVLPLANGGTGSATQNFVDLTTNQSIAGQKTFTDDTAIDASGSGDALTITHSGSGDGLSVNHSGSGIAATITGTVDVTGQVNSDNLTLNGNTVSSTDTNGNIILDPNGTGNVNLPDLTISQPAYIDASGNLVSQDLSLTSDVSGILPEANGGTGLDASAVTDGQLLIGNTSDNTFDLATLTGTTDQVSVTNGNGSITLATPQDIATTSSPTFAGVTSTGDILMSGTGQIDLPVGTTAQRSGSPNSGMLRFNSDTSQFEGYDGSSWGEIGGTGGSTGGGGGGLDIFYNEDHETGTDSSSYTTGLNATFDNGGTLGGALADETTNPIAGATSIKYTTSATATNSTNDWIASASITLDDKQKGNFVGFNFFYTWDGSDDLLCVIVWDDTNNAVLNDSTDCLETASNPTRYSLGVFIPTSTNAIKLGFHHTGTSESSKVLVFDDLELSSNPFVYKNLTETGEFFVNDSAGRPSSGETYGIYFNSAGIQKNTLSGFGTVTEGSSSTGAKFTANRKCVVTAYLNFENITNTAGIGFTINGDLTASILSNPASGIRSFARASDPGRSFTSSVTVELEAGDVLAPHLESLITLETGNDYAVSLGFVVQAPAEHVVTPQKNNIVSVLAEGNGGESITAATTNVTFTEVIDSDGAWDGTTYTVQDSNSVIHINASVYFTTSNSRQVDMYVNGTRYKKIGDYLGTDVERGNYKSVKGEFTEGDAITFRIAVNGGTLSSDSLFHFLNITEYKDAQILSAIPVPLVVYLDTDATLYQTSVGGSASYKTQDIVSVSGDSSFVSVSSNQFTLQRGKYFIEFGVGANNVGGWLDCVIYNITDSANHEEFLDVTQSSISAVHFNTVYSTIEISSSKTYEIRTKSGASGFEYLSRVKITKIK